MRILSPAAGEGLAFVFSDVTGWNDRLEAAARRLAASGAVVVGVDLPGYLEGLRRSDDGCHYVVAELEDLSHRLQREHGFASYASPLLAGLGAGGTLAYAALAQAPAATIAGALSIDPAATLDTRVPLCAGAPATPVAGSGFRYGPVPTLPGFWWLSGPAPEAALAGLASPSVPAASGTPEARLAELGELVLARSGSAENPLGDLPLVELPSTRPTGQMAVILSGDGGWRDLDKQIGEVLASAGTPVVGLDSLRYFWHEKTPDQLAADLGRIVQHYRERWGAKRVLLVGYSFGANVLPFAVNRLSPEARDSIVQVSLLGLARHAPFEFAVSGWLGRKSGGPAVLPELEKLDPRRIQCVYGREEPDTLCTDPKLEGVERIETSGGHHFDGDYQALARRILAGATRRAAPPTTPAATSAR